MDLTFGFRVVRVFRGSPLLPFLVEAQGCLPVSRRGDIRL